MIEPEYVKRTVDHEPRQLPLDRNAESARVPLRNPRANVDVANHWSRAAASFEPERDHVRRAIARQVVAVETCNRSLSDKRDGYQRITNALGLESRPHDLSNFIVGYRKMSDRRRDIDTDASRKPGLRYLRAAPTSLRSRRRPRTPE